tara:strand:- start:355 stop:1026 length:672 start_codon:yes stop_codon:yes gene_type:complete
MNTGLELHNELLIFFFAISIIIWLGLTFYSNFISQQFLMNSNDEAKRKYFTYIQPDVMWYMRWSALLAFLIGLYLMSFLSNLPNAYNIGTSLAAAIITIMVANTWLVIWPKQKKIIANTQDAKKCEQRYDLALRTNGLLSLPLVGLILHAAQTKIADNPLISSDGSIGSGWYSLSLWISLLVVVSIELNLFFGKNRKWMDSPKKLIISSLIITIFIGLMLRIY